MSRATPSKCFEHTLDCKRKVEVVAAAAPVAMAVEMGADEAAVERSAAKEVEVMVRVRVVAAVKSEEK